MAPEQGRQSPDPENQTGAQQKAPPAENPNQGDSSANKGNSADALKNLESNPEHILQKHAEEKTSKTQGSHADK